jgi:type I restriction enzyme, S subunit
MNHKIFRYRNIPKGWVLKKISDVSSTGSGGTPLSRCEEYYKGGTIPWINSGEVGKFSIKSTNNYISPTGMKNSSAKLFPRGSVLLAMYGATAGRASLLEIEATTNQAICAIMPKPGYSAEFIKYYLDVLYEYLVSVSTGSARDNLTQNGIQELEIPFPDEKSQILVASILSCLDSKIYLNNRINAELEATAKLIYDYWFVQFDFPDENGNPYKSNGGKMIWNEELRKKLPQGWVHKPLEKVATLVKDIVLPKDLMPDTPYIGLEHIPRKSFILSDWETSTKVDSAKCSFKKGDILFGKIRPYFHKVGVSFTKGITSTDTIVLRAVDPDLHGIILQTVFSDDFVLAATQSSTGSKMPRADWSILKNYSVLIPPTEIVSKYQALSNQIIERIGNSIIQNHQLSSLRDWLLPMLMNGQVNVVDAAEISLNMAAEPVQQYGRRH